MSAASVAKVQPGTRRWTTLVDGVIKAQSGLQWAIGDALLEIAPVNGADELSTTVENTLRQFAVDADLPYAWTTLRNFRRVASVYPKTHRTHKVAFSVYNVLSGHPECKTVIKTVKLISEAQRVMREYREEHPEHYDHKLTPSDAAAIVKSYKKGNTTQRKLAEDYGVHHSSISKVLSTSEKRKSTGHPTIKSSRRILVGGLELSVELYEAFSKVCLISGKTEAQITREAITELVNKLIKVGE